MIWTVEHRLGDPIGPKGPPFWNTPFEHLLSTQQRPTINDEPHELVWTTISTQLLGRADRWTAVERWASSPCAPPCGDERRICKLLRAGRDERIITGNLFGCPTFRSQSVLSNELVTRIQRSTEKRNTGFLLREVLNAKLGFESNKWLRRSKPQFSDTQRAGASTGEARQGETRQALLRSSED